MTLLKLRHHNPISSPGNREPADGTESDMRVSLGFEPAWFHRRCGIDFSESWHKDPLYRSETLKQMKVELARAFPTVSSWDLSITEDVATLSGCYGTYVLPQVFGMRLLYAKDRWPDLDPASRPTQEQIEHMNIRSLLAGPFVEELFNQMDTIASRWGKVHGYLNWQGVLNNAFHLRGQDLFLDMVERPDWIHAFFSKICEVMIQLASLVEEKQRRSGFYINQFSVSNCVVNMISPGMYREFVFPHDKKIALSFERFGVHTCNWNITPYVEAFRDLPNLGYLDMGMESDFVKVKALFPDTRRAVMYWPTRLQDASMEEMKRDLDRVHQELAPCDVVMADIQASTPDQRVNQFLEVCRCLESNELPRE
jgi:hypothetical protein